MDPWLLGLLIDYKNLPDRAGELWDIMETIRKEIVHEEIHKNREPVIAHKIQVLSKYEKEFRDILIECLRTNV